MKNKFLLILQSCDRIHDLDNEFKKPFGWLRFKEKKEYKNLKSKLINLIEDLSKDTWTVKYIIDMEFALIAYYSKLEEFMYNFYIRDWNNESLLNKFKPICITDENRVYMIEIIANNLTFTIFDTRTGENIQIISGNETSDSQKKIESICKTSIINILKDYLEGSIEIKNQVNHSHRIFHSTE